MNLHFMKKFQVAGIRTLGEKPESNVFIYFIAVKQRYTFY